MRWLGICERAFDLMCERALTRTIAPGETLGDKQTIQNWIAECRAEINAARLLIQDAAEKIDSIGASNARAEISIIKFYCANVLQKVVDCAIQVHGALGVTDDTILAFYYRHERAARIYDGADEVQKSFGPGNLKKVQTSTLNLPIAMGLDQAKAVRKGEQLNEEKP